MKRVFLTFLLIFSLQPSTANAVVVKSMKALIELPYLKSDQISDVVLTPVSAILIGTTESLAHLGLTEILVEQVMALSLVTLHSVHHCGTCD